MNEALLTKCNTLVEKGCTAVTVMVSCPLGFECGHSTPSDFESGKVNDSNSEGGGSSDANPLKVEILTFVIVAVGTFALTTMLINIFT
jgi:hypothetical protein